MRKFFALLATVVLLWVGAGAASALPSTTTLVDRGLQELGTFYGHISWSLDGNAEPSHVAGNNLTVRVNKPAGASVRKAFFISGDGGNRNTSGHTPRDVRLNGHSVVYSHWAKITTDPGGDAWNNFNTYYADVTDLVGSTIDAAPSGISTMTLDQGDGTDGDSVEGGSLIVVFDDPSAPLSSIYLKGGTSDPAGDTFAFNFPALTVENLNNQLLMSVGISNSFQTQWWEQSSNITANSTLLSSISGGCDDSTTFATTGCNFGGYNTIGGVGDTVNNPGFIDTEVTPGDINLDKELYNLNAVLSVGSTSLSVNTNNPSRNDNIYFAGVYLRGILPTADYCTVHAAECAPAAFGSLPNTGFNPSGPLWFAGAALVLGLGLIAVRRRRA
jgi:LPXTG-motif cell wall-anchored protein